MASKIYKMLAVFVIVAGIINCISEIGVFCKYQLDYTENTKLIESLDKDTKSYKVIDIYTNRKTRLYTVTYLEKKDSLDLEVLKVKAKKVLFADVDTLNIYVIDKEPTLVLPTNYSIDFGDFRSKTNIFFLVSGFVFVVAYLMNIQAEKRLYLVLNKQIKKARQVKRVIAIVVYSIALVCVSALDYLIYTQRLPY